jgi:hypothetical protein
MLSSPLDRISQPFVRKALCGEYHLKPLNSLLCLILVWPLFFDLIGLVGPARGLGSGPLRIANLLTMTA